MDNKFLSETPIFNNQTCPEGIKKAHATAKGVWAELIVLKGMIEFIWEDTNEKILVDTTKPLKIDSERLHHVNLLWDVEFKIRFYKL